jgi:hypothetical protein
MGEGQDLQSKLVERSCQLDSPLGAAIVATGAFTVTGSANSLLKDSSEYWDAKLLLEATMDGRVLSLLESNGIASSLRRYCTDGDRENG